MLFNIVAPFVDCIKYPDCIGTTRKNVDKETELLGYLTICRHSLHLGIMAHMLNIFQSTVDRFFVGWAIFLETLFSKLDLKPYEGYLIKNMPEIFIKTGHGLTNIVIDCTEFKFQQASNYDVNCIMFSNYKNTHTGKALIGISPHGTGLLFSDIYPGSISDTEISEKVGVLDWVEPEHEVMADRGFSLQDYCASKGVYLNRPAQKSNPQFAANFDIAATRIHVERFIGRVRDWTILNTVWPIHRIDLLSSVWKSLCHIVNMTMEHIDPN